MFSIFGLTPGLSSELHGSLGSDLQLHQPDYGSRAPGPYDSNPPDYGSRAPVSSYLNDCRHEDPMIRGLALRRLCSMNVANLVESLVGPLQWGLQDTSSYVRAVAATGVLKLYRISAPACAAAGFPSTLKHLMLYDPDTQVVAICLSALQEIWRLEANTWESEALLSNQIIYYFLNRIKEFNEWAQCIVLDLVSKYVPADSNEIYHILNLLRDQLQHANGAVVLATVKVFLRITQSVNDIHQQVYEDVKASLFTLVNSGSPEQSSAVLCHMRLLVMRVPMLFSSDYGHFCCQYNEPFYVKKLKLDMLTWVADKSNTYEIVTKLCEYVANVDVHNAREFIRAVGKILLKQYDANAIVDRLLQFLNMEKDYVTAETSVLLKYLLTKYPQWSHEFTVVVGNIYTNNVQEENAKAALIWMLHEYSRGGFDVNYVQESLIDNWESPFGNWESLIDNWGSPIDNWRSRIDNWEWDEEHPVEMSETNYDQHKVLPETEIRMTEVHNAFSTIDNRRWDEEHYVETSETRDEEHISTEVQPETDTRMTEVEEALSHIIGMKDLKLQIRKWVKVMLLNEKRKLIGLNVGKRKAPHMAFLGNPGTGKTTIARILGKLLCQVGIISNEKVTEVQRGDLIGEYIGQTGPKTQKKIEEAEGGVLFVDEAYRLVPGEGNPNDYGKEALEEIMSKMDSGEIVVIFAGYSEPMKRVISSNEGFARRVTKSFTFADYTSGELAEIVKVKMTKQKEDDPLYGFKLHTSCSLEAIRMVIERGTTEAVRNKMNGGLADIMLANAQEILDHRLDLNNATTEELLTITLDDLQRGLACINKI